MAKRLVIAGACRTPIGKFGETLKDVSAQELLKTCFAETINRTRIDPNLIDEAVAGTCMHLSDAPNIARVSWLMAGLPEKTPSFSVQRNCGSGIQAIVSAARAILAGDGEIYLAGSTESMSNTPAVFKRGSFNYNLGSIEVKDSLLEGLTDHLTGEVMWQTAENIARKYGITRKEQDVFSAQSHKKAFAAIQGGRFESQVVPVPVKKNPVPMYNDEGPSAEATEQTLAVVPTMYKIKKGEAGATPEQIKTATVTPANSCQISDGAASILVLTLEKAKELGIEPQAEILSWGFAGVNPSYMGEGPICVMPIALKRAGLILDDIDVFENNEAFAAISVAWERNVHVAPEKHNIYGGAIALGHPVGATGVILTVKAIYLLKDLEKTHALISLCVGGGQGAGLIVRNFA